MSWEDFEDILYDGTEKEIANLSCPICGQNIAYTYTPEINCFSYVCNGCGHKVRSFGGSQPNCVKYFGNSAELPTNTAKAV